MTAPAIRIDVDMAFTAIDLFCGAGGLTLGLEAAGIDVILGADNWGPAVKTYRQNFRHPCVETDISKLTADELFAAAGIRSQTVDLLVGGPPCQGFSVQRIGDDADVRNNLVLDFARLVEEVRPKMFLMENVLGLLGKRGRVIVQNFRSVLHRCGYTTDIARVNTAHFGVPQLRRRVFLYGGRDGSSPNFPEPTHDEHEFVTVWDAIGDLPKPPEDFTPSPSDPLHRRTRMSALNLERIRCIPAGGGMQDLPVELRANCHQNGPDRIGHRYVYGRLPADAPAGTITARFDSFTRGRFGHPFDDRNVTLREGARLQTFCDSFRFVGSQEEIAALIGNAVPPRLAHLIGKSFASSNEAGQLSLPFDRDPGK